MFDLAVERLEGMGYALKDNDDNLLRYILRKVTDEVLVLCNIAQIPERLERTVADMAAAEFLLTKKVFAPSDIEGLDLTAAVKSVQEGDTSVSYALDGASLSPEQRFDSLIKSMRSPSPALFSAYRKLRW